MSSGFDGSNLLAVVQAMTTACGFPHALGTPDDAEHTFADRVIWIPRSRGHRKATQQRDDYKACLMKAWTVDLAIYGADFARVDALLDQVLVGLDELLSLNAYQPVGETVPRGGTLGAAGFGLTQRVVIYGPVVERRFGELDVAGYELHGELSSPSGEVQVISNG